MQGLHIVGKGLLGKLDDLVARMDPGHLEQLVLQHSNRVLQVDLNLVLIVSFQDTHMTDCLRKSMRLEDWLVDCRR